MPCKSYYICEDNPTTTYISKYLLILIAKNATANEFQ